MPRTNRVPKSRKFSPPVVEKPFSMKKGERKGDLEVQIEKAWKKLPKKEKAKYRIEKPVPARKKPSLKTKKVGKAKFREKFEAIPYYSAFDRQTNKYYPKPVAVDKFGMKGSDYYYRTSFKIMPIVYSPYLPRIDFFERGRKGELIRLFEIWDSRTGIYTINKPQHTFVNLMFNPQYSYDWTKGFGKRYKDYYSFSQYPNWYDENRYLRLTITCYFRYVFGKNTKSRGVITDIIDAEGIQVSKFVFVFGNSVRNVIANRDFGRDLFNFIDFYFEHILGHKDTYVLIAVYVNRIDVGYKCRFRGLAESEYRRITEMSESISTSVPYAEVVRKLKGLI